MYWQEKIDRLKKQFPQTDFRDPFTDWPEILKNIESKFIIKCDTQYHFTNWPEHIKEQQIIRTIPRQNLAGELIKLDDNTNYWIVVSGNTPTAKSLVYDCKLRPLNAVISMIPGHFCIIEKKYRWFTFFKADDQEIAIIKSGPTATPFDK